MTFFSDLSPSTYGSATSYSVWSGMYLRFSVENTVNIGWLGPEMPGGFPMGETSEKFQNQLFALCSHHLFSPTRGYHICELPDCQPRADSTWFMVARRGHRQARLGSAEIRVPGPERIYAAPNMIYHYVVDHHYLPPQEFIDAVLACPPPPSPRFWYRYNQLEKVQLHP